MAAFDREDGRFIARPGKEIRSSKERDMFKDGGWQFDRAAKLWYTTDHKKAEKWRKIAVGAAKEYFDNLEAAMKQALEESWAEDSDQEFPIADGYAYMPFQKAGIAYAIKRERTLIADPPGLGKTLQAIGVSNATKPNKVLVVCPASLKVNWSREWRRFDSNGMTVGIAMSIPKTKQVDGVKNSWTEYDFPDTDVVIINYDMLETFDEKVKSQTWDMVVFDEAHLLKSRDAVRTKIVFGGKKPARKKDGKVIEKAKKFTPIMARRHLYLTGTPIMSKPVELWTLILACDPKGLGRSFNDYAYLYCAAYEGDFGLDTSGASNLEELGTRLRTSFMVRRDKESVLKELPPKRREVILFPADKLERPIKKEKTRVEAALSAFEAALGIDDTSGDFRFISAVEGLCERLADAMAAQDSEEPNWNSAVKQLSAPDQILFTELAEAREEVALAKTKLVAAHVKDLHDCGEPVILFAYHKSVVEELREKLTKLGMRVGIVTGSVPPMKRQAVVDDFQNGDLDVIIGNITAMGVGFTLTRARFVVFAELDWVPAMIEQAEDRAWRNGQLNAVMVQHLLVDGSIESRMAVVILEKMEVIFEALDAIRVDKA